MRNAYLLNSPLPPPKPKGLPVYNLLSHQTTNVTSTLSSQVHGGGRNNDPQKWNGTRPSPSQLYYNYNDLSFPRKLEWGNQSPFDLLYLTSTA